MAAAIDSVFEFINALPGVWQAAAYIFLLTVLIGIIRAFPIICRVLWNLIIICLSAALTYIWWGIRYTLRPVFRPVAPLFRPVALLFWRLCNAMGIWSPAQRRAEGYRWIPGFGWYQRHPIWTTARDRRHAYEQRQEQAQAQEQEQRQRQKRHEYKPQHDAPENPLQEACQFFNLPQDGSFDRATLKKRYRELIKALHPDKMRHTKRAADEFTKRINAAKDIIEAAKGWK